MTKVKPILRWAGGKNWLTSHIDKYLPTSFNDYHEPFVGGASIYLHLKESGHIKHKTYLSDTNEELINAYKVIKTDPKCLIETLSSYMNEQSFYYQIRSTVPDNETMRAAKFLYLNRTSFNGIYRENLRGEYNVPFGNRNLTCLFDDKNIIEFSKKLASVRLNSCDFEQCLSKIKQNDLVFLDPPYTVAHENNGFIKYNKKIFSWEDQGRLKKFIDEIKSRGAYFILTNAAHYSIDDLYGGVGDKEKLSRSSNIGGKGAKREKYNEYVFFNTI